MTSLPTPDFISSLVEQQFPSFYREEGENFVAFVKAYYEWLEENNQSLDKSRNLFNTRDIDLTADAFVEQFKAKYLFGIPKQIAGDKRFLQKHILDVYRSKGSIEGLQLLFRLLYNEEIRVYIPSVDILKASDGTWIEEKYLEVSYTDYNDEFENKLITGVTSGATAFVESSQKIYIDNKIINVFYISNISGEFKLDEKVVYEGLLASDAPRIMGSPVSFDVSATFPDNLQGDTLVPLSSNGSGVGFKSIVSETRGAAASNATIEFVIQSGGSGYTTTPQITITAGSNTSGNGATFTGVTLKDTTTFTYNNNFISAVSTTALNAVNYGPTLNNATLSTVLDLALTNFTTTIGTIDRLTGINPGNGYDGSITISVSEPAIAGYGISDANGAIVGDNADILGRVVIGDGLVNSVKVKNSGFGYHSNFETLGLYNDSQSNTSKITIGSVNLGAVGFKEGYWSTSKGFLDSNKYIQDSYFYQEYSYQILSSQSLDKYLSVLKDVFHPAGNQPFGRAFIFSEDDSQKVQIANDITVFRIIGAALAPSSSAPYLFELNKSRLV